MESRVEAADVRHRKGYNCSQAVACTYADLFGVSEEEAFRAMEGFGLGMGGMEGTCGALSGACYLVGLATSDVNTEKPGTKKACYKLSREIVERFREQNGATQCRELKGVGTEHGVLRPCPDCIADACRLVEDILLASE